MLLLPLPVPALLLLQLPAKPPLISVATAAATTHAVQVMDSVKLCVRYGFSLEELTAMPNTQRRKLLDFCDQGLPPQQAAAQAQLAQDTKIEDMEDADLPWN